MLRETAGELRREVRGGHLCVRELTLCLRPLLRPRVGGRLMPVLEMFSSQYGHERLRLREFMVEDLFPGFEKAPVEMAELPRGIGSTPIPDQVVLAKLVRTLGPRFMLEAGSYRGYTAKLIARHLPDDAHLYTLDIDPQHGEAYGAQSTGKILRFVAPIDHRAAEILGRSSFDFIFLDANHERAYVEADTKALLPLLADDGVFVWHDYSDWGWISGSNRVPEALSTLSREMAILCVPCTGLAIHRKSWSSGEVDRAVAAWGEQKRKPQSETLAFNNPPITNPGTL